MVRRAYSMLATTLSLVAASGAIAPLSAQNVASRPAAVQLIVVKPSTPLQAADWITPTAVRSRRLPSGDFEIATAAGLGGRVLQRLEVIRPHVERDFAAGTLTIRDASGAFVPFPPGAAIKVANEEPGQRPVADVVLRAIEVGATDTLAVPLTFRLSFGSGERRSVWTYTVPVRIDVAPNREP